MTSKGFVLSVVTITAGLAVLFAAYNFAQDDFGLFWSSGAKRIWTLEKTSKYLMSYRYIPRNFDGLLLGPSFSDGFMDTRKLRGYRVYNLSMDAGNATELRAAAVNAINRGHFQFIIVCLTPFITMNHGMQGPQINPKEYLGSLFSWIPFEVLQAKFYARRHPATDEYTGSEWGMGLGAPRKVYPWKDYVRAVTANKIVTDIDPTAYDDLKDIIDAARARQVRVFAYFFPYDIWRWQIAADSGEWDSYRARMLRLFDQADDVVLDLTTADYDPMRRDAACYTDSHLSQAGANLVLSELQRMLDQSLRGITAPSSIIGSTQLLCLGRPGAGSGFDRRPPLTIAASY